MKHFDLIDYACMSIITIAFVRSVFLLQSGDILVSGLALSLFFMLKALEK